MSFANCMPEGTCTDLHNFPPQFLNLPRKFYTTSCTAFLHNYVSAKNWNRNNSVVLCISAQVVVGGEYVSGPGSLVVDANSSTTYPLTFAPSLIGDTSGE